VLSVPASLRHDIPNTGREPLEFCTRTWRALARVIPFFQGQMAGVECDPRFAELIRDMAREPLDEGPEVIYGVWPDLTLAYTNASWRAFALANGGEEVLTKWGLGSSLREATGAALCAFYDHAFARALATGRPWQHLYACPSPNTYRWFSVRALPLRREGLLICHSPVGELVPTAERPASDRLYRDRAGLVTQCSHCRRVRLAGEPRVWHFVPAFVREIPRQTSHGLCPVCVDYHYRGVLTPAELRSVIGESAGLAASNAA
jgi:hypothetical protein